MTNETAQARISWTTVEEGGRNTLPIGQQYSTVVWFEAEANHWPDTGWSVVVECTELCSGELSPQTRETCATIRFLSPDAPVELLHPGSRFGLFEGRRKVAQGIVLE